MLFIAPLLLLSAGCDGDGGSSQAAPPPPPQVTVAQPLRQQIVEWDRYTGRLAAVQAVEVHARVSGYLNSIHFEEGEVVQEGQLLFVVDPRPFEAALRIANAGLEEARAGLGKAQAELRRAEAEQAQAEVDVELARRRQARAESLIARNAIATEELDVRESEYLSAQADVEAAKASVASAEAAVTNAEAAIESAKAAVARAELDLQYTRIKAPITGRASDWNIDVGDLVAGGNQQTSPLTTIVSTDPIHAYFDASERQLLKYKQLERAAGRRGNSLQASNPVYLGLADDEGLPYRGHMDFVDNRVDPNTGTIRGRAIFPNPDQQLVPGMFARLRIPGSAPYEAVLIPDSAIGTDQTEQYVLIVNDEGLIERRIIETGPRSHGLRIVRSGLDGSERLVIRGLQGVRDGVKVTTTEQAIEATDESVLPDQFEPVPREQRLTIAPRAAAAK